MPENVAHNPLPQSYLDLVYQHEDGGKFVYVDNPGDRGGPTKGGVTLATLAEYRGHPCTAQDVKDLTKTEADALYQELFWTRPGFDTLPLDAATLDCVFDFGMGSGPRTATKTLQRVLGISPDGVIGPGTRAACTAYVAAHPNPALNNAYVKARIQFYDAIVANDASQAKWLNGWCIRANSFLVPVAPSKRAVVAARLKSAGTHAAGAAVGAGTAVATLGGPLQAAHDRLLPLADGHPILQKAAVVLGVGAIGCGLVGAGVRFSGKTTPARPPMGAPAPDPNDQAIADPA